MDAPLTHPRAGEAIGRAGIVAHMRRLLLELGRDFSLTSYSSIAEYVRRLPDKRLLEAKLAEFAAPSEYG